MARHNGETITPGLVFWPYDFQGLIRSPAESRAGHLHMYMAQQQNVAQQAKLLLVREEQGNKGYIPFPQHWRSTVL